MPAIRYEAAAGKLSVTLDPAIPELTPLLVSHPGDGFDPGDPWFDLLDPTKRGMAFSRRYGFVMDAASDPLPPDTAIRIRLLSLTPGLEIYRYRGMEPKLWEPIFGTAGSLISLRWDGMMFHPVFAAVPGTNTYSADFEASLVEATTGTELPNSGTGPFTMNWTGISDGRPQLSIAMKVVISCPPEPDFVLESTDALDGGAWTVVTNAPVMLDGQSAVVLDASEARKFYRTRKSP